MVRIAKSDRQKRHDDRKNVSAKQLAAVEAYWERQALAPSTTLSIRAIAREFGVNHVTLGHDLDPKCRSIDEFNASKTKLSAVQEAELVRWAVSLADQNLALTSALIHENASLLYQSTNPGRKLGRSWTNRFLDRHQDELARHWSRPLDKVRAMSATPVSMKQYFDAYRSLVGEDGKKIPPHRQFAYDECGVQRGYSQVTRVISSCQNNAAKVNKGGSRELITFIPIISGSGELVTSVVVFPGRALREGWVKDNPGNYAVTCSAQGFMNDLLGLEFIKLFHESTAHLEKEGPRLLHVDCHSSHINLPLINFARAHNIIIFGYPPHTTHLLQGLDVVLFSPFKNAYAKHAAEHLKQTGEEVGKSDFLSVVHHALQDSFTEKNILMAWKKTGLCPIDPSVISERDLAPSKEFSTAFTLPLTPPSPIRAVVDAIHRQNTLQDPHYIAAAARSLNLQPLATPPPEHPQTPKSNSPFISLANCSQQTPQDAEALPPTRPLLHRLPPLHPSDYPDPLTLLAARVNSMSLESPPNLSSDIAESSSASAEGDTRMGLGSKPPEDFRAIYTAGEILRSLASTRLAPLLELDTVTSTCKLPPIERGPLPLNIAEAIKASEEGPSPELWEAIKVSFPAMVSRVDWLLAQAVLQETYCQQVQLKLKSKEKPKNETALKTVMGLGEGLIFTGDRIHAALVQAAVVREKEKVDLESQRSAKELKRDATAWMEAAVARQTAVHTALIDAWRALPPASRTRRQPAKPPLDTAPPGYLDALKTKKRKTKKRTHGVDVPDSDDDYVD